MQQSVGGISLLTRVRASSYPLVRDQLVCVATNCRLANYATLPYSRPVYAEVIPLLQVLCCQIYAISILSAGVCEVSFPFHSLSISAVSIYIPVPAAATVPLVWIFLQDSPVNHTSTLLSECCPVVGTIQREAVRPSLLRVSLSHWCMPHAPFSSQGSDRHPPLSCLQDAGHQPNGLMGHRRL